MIASVLVSVVNKPAGRSLCRATPPYSHENSLVRQVSAKHGNLWLGGHRSYKQ